MDKDGGLWSLRREFESLPDYPPLSQTYHDKPIMKHVSQVKANGPETHYKVHGERGPSVTPHRFTDPNQMRKTGIPEYETQIITPDHRGHRKTNN